MMEQEKTEETPANNWQTRYLVGGGIIGGLIGVFTAYWLVRTSEETRGAPPEISTGDVLKSVVGIIGLIRGIASLGD